MTYDHFLTLVSEEFQKNPEMRYPQVWVLLELFTYEGKEMVIRHCRPYCSLGLRVL